MPIDKSIDYSAITPEIKALTKLCLADNVIEPEMYVKYAVNRGLRDLNGNGVLTGLTEISEIQSSKMVDGEKVPCEGKLFYRGVDVEQIVSGFIREKRYGFEETVYLLLFGALPDEAQLDDFKKLLAGYRSLPTNFVRDVILKAPNADMMNTLARSVLTLYSYDARATDNSTENVLRQCLQLIALFPMLSVYGYQAYSHYVLDKSLFIHNPVPELSTAENLLHILRADGKYTELEARILDLALVLHAEHGGGNNSTFTMHVVTSSGTDTYSAVAASLASLKGPKHGGANIKVVQMFEDMKQNVRDWTDEEAVEAYLRALLHREAFDRAGLIYGMGHAVYTVSDPRAQILKNHARRMAYEKGYDEEFEMLCSIERLAPQVFAEEKHGPKKVCANVDLFSGLIYRMLGISEDLYTPLFAIARVPGWCAHRVEEVEFANRIIRPAYKYVGQPQAYVTLENR